MRVFSQLDVKTLMLRFALAGGRKIKPLKHAAERAFCTHTEQTYIGLTFRAADTLWQLLWSRSQVSWVAPDPLLDPPWLRTVSVLPSHCVRSLLCSSYNSAVRLHVSCPVCAAWLAPGLPARSSK